MDFVGIDLTSAYSKKPRSVDLAILNDSGRHATFRMWNWPGREEVRSRSAALVESLLYAIGRDAGTIALAVDGPQGLASTGRSVRAAERALGTPGRTSDHRCDIDDVEPRPFAFYIESSLDLFHALNEHAPELTLFGLEGQQSSGSRLFEVFPGSEWQVLSGRRLFKKTTRAGRLERAALWQRLGISWDGPELPTADQNDALLAAVLAWAAHREPQWVESVGDPPLMEDGQIREGWILHFNRSLQMHLSLSEGEGDVESAVDARDWSTDEARITFTDFGLVHGGEPENSWLSPPRNYRLRARPPYPPREFFLNYSSAFPSGRGWKCEPTIRELLRTLEVDVGGHLSRENRLAIAVDELPPL